MAHSLLCRHAAIVTMEMRSGDRSIIVIARSGSDPYVIARSGSDHYVIARSGSDVAILTPAVNLLVQDYSHLSVSLFWHDSMT